MPHVNAQKVLPECLQMFFPEELLSYILHSSPKESIWEKEFDRYSVIFNILNPNILWLKQQKYLYFALLAM